MLPINKGNHTTAYRRAITVFPFALQKSQKGQEGLTFSVSHTEADFYLKGKSKKWQMCVVICQLY